MTTEIYDKNYPECTLDLYLPENAKNPPLYVYIHGGGLENGLKDEVKPLADYLLENGVAVASVQYRLYPSAKYPEYVKDCANAVAYLVNNSARLGGFSSYTVGGSSAGAYLSMMLYFDKRFLKNAGVPDGTVTGYFFNAGQPTTHFNYIKYELKGDTRRVLIDETAAIYYLEHGYEHPESEPYILIACADHDMVNRLEQNRMLETAMYHMGFLREKLAFRVYDHEMHCTYLSKQFYFEDTLELVKKSNGGKI